MDNLIFPRPQFVDNNGDPLYKGYIVTYDTDGSTLKSTYPTKTDLKKRTNPNPTTIEINEKGYPEKDLWLLGAYDIKVYTAADALVFTVQDINDNTWIMADDGTTYLKAITASDSTSHIKISNSATTRNPRIESSGDLTIEPKGTGTVQITADLEITGALSSDYSPAVAETILGMSGDSAEIRLSEDTDNGTNYVAIKAPSSISANNTLTLPSSFSSGLAEITSNVLGFDAAGAKSLAQVLYAFGTSNFLSSAERQIAEVTLVPSSADSIILLLASASCNVLDAAGVQSSELRLYNDTTAIKRTRDAVKDGGTPSSLFFGTAIIYSESAGSTDSRTYRTKIAPTNSQGSAFGHLIAIELAPVA